MPGIILVVHIFRGHATYYLSSRCLRLISYFFLSLSRFIIFQPTFVNFPFPYLLYHSYFIFSYLLVSVIDFPLPLGFPAFLFIALLSLSSYCFRLFQLVLALLTQIVLLFSRMPSFSVNLLFLSMASLTASVPGASELPGSPLLFPPHYSVEQCIAQDGASHDVKQIRCAAKLSQVHVDYAYTSCLGYYSGDLA